MVDIVLVTGGFDPLHSGHIAYFVAARELGDKLIVGVNSDDWLVRKKGRAFMPFADRAAIIKELKCVDDVIAFDDSDDSACQAIEQVLKDNHYDLSIHIIFANGGDRKPGTTPEESRYYDEGQVKFVFGVGGDDKLNSSSWILDEWKAPKTIRPWGYYRVLHEDDGVKVKELTVDPGKSLSMQRHQFRSEFWLIGAGSCIIHSDENVTRLNKHTSTFIKAGDWHQLTNPFTEPCKIIEIQYGTECIETDIERQ